MYALMKKQIPHINANCSGKRVDVSNLSNTILSLLTKCLFKMKKCEDITSLNTVVSSPTLTSFYRKN